MTTDKLKELQGPEGFPGFPSEFGALHTNLNVVVYLSKPTGTTSKDPKKKPNQVDISDIIGGGTKVNPDMPEEITNPNTPQVMLVVIMTEKK